MENNNKQQWKKRVDVFRYIYSYLNDKNNPISTDNLDSSQEKVIKYFLDNFDTLVNLIKPLISKSWTWERTRITDKAIIMTAYCENKVNSIPKKVVIDQAVINAKNYGEPNSYKFVNAILDKIIVE